MKTNRMKITTIALALGSVATMAFVSPVQPAYAEAFTEEQKTELNDLIKKYLMENPDIILNSVDEYRRKEEVKSQQSAQDNLKQYQEYFKSPDRPMAGNPNGDITVVEFFDYNCGYCKKAFTDIQALLKEDPNVRIVFQEMPILSPASQTMAVLAEAAHKQGKYFEMHAALMDHRGQQTPEAFNEIAQKIGLDLTKLEAEKSSADIETSIKKSMTMARDLGIRGTPGFVIGDQIYPGYIGIDGLKNAIAEERAKTKAPQ